MIVSSFTDTRGDNTVKMDVALVAHGKAVLYIDAHVHMECDEHRKTYINHIEGEVACSTKLNRQDMDELEAAIRGWPEPAHKLAWRTVQEIIKMQDDQCHRV